MKMHSVNREKLQFSSIAHMLRDLGLKILNFMKALVSKLSSETVLTLIHSESFRNEVMKYSNFFWNFQSGHSSKKENGKYKNIKVNINYIATALAIVQLLLRFFPQESTVIYFNNICTTFGYVAEAVNGIL